MATLKEIVEYSKANPNTDYAQQAFKKIKSGAWDDKAKEEGYSLGWAGRPGFEEEQSDTPEEGSFLAKLLRDRGDIGGDFLDVGKGIKEGFTKKTKRIGSNIARRGEDGMDASEKVATALDVGGAALSTLTDSVFQAGLGLAKAVLSEEQEQAISAFVQKGAEFAGQSTAVQNIVKGWNEFEQNNPEAASNMRAAGDFTQVLADVTGLRLGGAGSKATVEAASEVIKKSTPLVEKAATAGADVAKKGADALKTGTDEALAAGVAARATQLDKEVEDIVGSILQGKKADIDKGSRALADIDTKGIKTYEELNARVDDQIGALVRKQDEYLTIADEQLGNLKTEELVTKTTVGKQTVEQNFVTKALDDLEELYRKTAEEPSVARIQQLREKIDAEGISRVELNNLAREYNVDFGDKAFSKVNGDPLTSVNAQAYENVRSGIKDTLRGSIKGDTSKSIDARMADLYNTRRLTKKIEEKVNGLYQRVQDRTLGEKLGRFLADAADVATLGSLKGFMTRLIPSNVGYKTMNSIDIENALAKNLERLEKIEKIKDDQGFITQLGTLMRGLGANARKEAAGARKADAEAFGLAAGVQVDEDGNIKFSPTAAALGVIGATVGRNVVKEFFKKEPPFALLKDMETFIDYQRVKKVPEGYKDATAFEADIRDAVAKFGIDPNKSNAVLANQFDEILQVARYSEKGAKKKLNNATPALDDIASTPKEEVIYHSSNDAFKEGKPDFDAYFGNKNWKDNFANEFGGKEYELILPKGSKVLNLESGTEQANKFMADVARREFPDDVKFADDLLKGDTDAIDEFYEIWTDKSVVLPIIKEMGIDGALFRDEYLLTKELIGKLKTAN